MQGTNSTRRRSTHALVYLALLAAAACSDEHWRPANPVAPTEPPPPASAVWEDLGAYSVTMTAAPSCSLPDYAMLETYDGRLKGSGQHLVATFDDSRFVAWEGPAGFAGTRDGDTVRFTLNGDYFSPGYSFVYLVQDGTELTYTGTASGTMIGSNIVATLTGTVLLRSYHDLAELARCYATDHRMELVHK